MKELKNVEVTSQVTSIGGVKNLYASKRLALPRVCADIILMAGEYEISHKVIEWRKRMPLNTIVQMLNALVEKNPGFSDESKQRDILFRIATNENAYWSVCSEERRLKWPTDVAEIEAELQSVWLKVCMQNLSQSQSQ